MYKFTIGAAIGSFCGAITLWITESIEPIGTLLVMAGVFVAFGLLQWMQERQ